MKYLELAEEYIENVDLSYENYNSDVSDLLTIWGQGEVLYKGLHDCSIKVNFRNTKDCKVFIGKNFKGTVNIDFHGDSSIVYIGENCQFNGVLVRSIYTGRNFVFIGNGVTTTGKCTFFSGDGRDGGGDVKPALVIGDDCMFAWDITIRNTDAHPIYSFIDDTQINTPKIGAVIVEPHVWIGQGVSILKDVTVGACSILGLGTVVTKDVPRFSSATGVPAKFKTNEDVYWARGATIQCKEKAKYFSHRYRGA